MLRKNELIGVWSAKRKYSYDLVTAALVLFSTPPFTSGHRTEKAQRQTREGPGNGPGGHRARETRTQAETAKNKEPGGGEGGGGLEGSEGYVGLSCFATALADPSLASSQLSSFAAWPPLCSFRSVVRLFGRPTSLQSDRPGYPAPADLSGCCAADLVCVIAASGSCCYLFQTKLH